MIAPVKVAVVGCGMISDAYLNTMKTKFKILDVVGCCDHNPEKAHEKALKYGIKVMTMDEIIADQSIEIVVNLTTPTAHYDVIQKLLEGGKHVYTEKVLTVELDQAAELVRLADAKKLYLGSAPDTFLGAAAQTARFVVDSGMIGEVTSCYCALNRDGSIFASPNSFTVKPGGGIGFDVGIYFITVLLSILGPVREVTGLVRTLQPERTVKSMENYGEKFKVNCETLMAGTLAFERGPIGTVLFDSNSVFVLPEKPAVAILGTKGIVYLADPNSFGGDVKVVLKGNNEPMVMQQSHAYTDECRGLGVAEMAWSMRLGRKNRANKEMAFHALDVLHGIVHSSQTGTAQKITSTFEIMPPLPRGFAGQTHFEQIEESSLM
jgi:predicted dehydrogenase